MILELISLLGVANVEERQAVPLFYISEEIAAEAPKTLTENIPAFGKDGFYVWGRNEKGIYIPATCESIDGAVAKRYYASDTAQAGDWMHAQVLCNHIKVVQQLKPAKVSYLEDDNFSRFEFFKDLLPKGVIQRMSEVPANQIEAGPCHFGGYSYCITINEIEPETNYNFGETFSITLQYAGDLNDDGAQDYVLFMRQNNLGGNGYWGTQILVTKRNLSNRVEELTFDWIVPAGGGN